MQGARFLPIRGDAANSSQSLLIMAPPDKETGVRQTVYLPVHRELEYNGSIWIKHLRGHNDVKVSLRQHDRTDHILVSATLDAPAKEWSKYTFHLKLQSGELARLEPADLTISVSDDTRIQIDEVSLVPADNIDGMDPDMIAMARELHSSLIRFGGNFTSAYDWHDGIGPQDKRVSKLNISWGIPEYNTFGTGEFLRFCELVHAQPQFALNLGTGTPEQAAEWVKYINQHWANHRGGLLWELGNELWGDFQVGYPGIERIATLTHNVSDAIKRIDPTARLIATGGDEDWFHNWNAAQLTNPPGTFDLLSTHFVVGDRVGLSHPSSNFRTMATLALPWGLAQRMRAIKDQIQQSVHKDRVNIAFTEWLMASGEHGSPRFDNMGGAVFAGGFLNMVLRNSDIVPVSDMTGIIEFGGIWSKRSQVYGAPAYWVLREYASAHPSYLLTVDNSSPTYSIAKGVDRLPEISGVPYFDVVATLSDDKTKLLLLCVNRHLTNATNASFDLSSFGHLKGTAKITTVASDSIVDMNDEENPDRITPSISHVPTQSTFTYRFSPSSVTIVEISLSR